jgi:paraquat-inducible protein A
MEPIADAELAECRVCALLQKPGPLSPGEAAVCPRCGAEVRRRKSHSIARTRALSLTGLLFYGPANYFPLVRVDYHGLLMKVTLWSSVRSLFEEGQWGVGALVMTTSIITPALKLLALFVISMLAGTGRWRLTRTRLYQLVDFVNPWNMLEIFMVAFVVGTVKFGSLATIQPGLGAWSFGAMVACTILAAQVFDPRVIWDEEAS